VRPSLHWSKHQVSVYTTHGRLREPGLRDRYGLQAETTCSVRSVVTCLGQRQREDYIRPAAGGHAPESRGSSATIGDRLAGFLGYSSIRTSATSASSWIQVRDALRARDGALHAVPLVYLIDSTPGVVCGAAAAPDWVITTDLHFSVVDRRTSGRLRADASLVRASRVGVLGQVVVVDENDDRIIAAGSVNHARVPLKASLDVPTMPVGVLFATPPASLALEANLSDELPFEAGPAAGELLFSARPLGVNPLGIVHGTVSTSLAMQAAEAFAGPGWTVTDVVSRYCGSIRKGPAVARPKLLSGGAGTRVVQVDIRDQAHATDPANLSWVTLRRDLETHQIRES
jgi:acyl-coenzyme A thioesterase PaaI-like protein